MIQQDIMLDLETLGTKPGCIVLSIGAVAFGPDGLGDELYLVLDTPSQRTAGLKTDLLTEAWWKKQSPEARRVFTEDQTPLPLVLDMFATFCAAHGGKDVRVWGNGSDFDNPILVEVYLAAKRPIPWKFYNNRCYRTLKGFDKSVAVARSGTHHNALDDAKTQALHAVRLLTHLGLWEKLLAGS